MIHNDALFQNLKDMSVLELAYWLTNLLNSVYRMKEGDNGVCEIDESALYTLYTDFEEAMNITDEEAMQHEGISDILIGNRELFKSKIYQKAIITMRQPLPEVELDTGKKKPLNITRTLYSQPVTVQNQLVNRDIDQRAQRYGKRITAILKISNLQYRSEIMEFIRKRKTERFHCKLYLPAKEFSDKNIDTTLERRATGKARKSKGPYKVVPQMELQKVEWVKDRQRKNWILSRPCVREFISKHGLSTSPSDYSINKNGEVRIDYDVKFDNGEGDESKGIFKVYKMFGGLKELIEYDISYAMKCRYGYGEPVKKDFMIRLAFFLGLPFELVEQLLLNEGFSIASSVRPADIIYRSCFKIGFPMEFADKLLRMKELPPLILDPKPKKRPHKILCKSE